MPSIDRATAAMRSALCDRRMLRFDAPALIGVVPIAGRTIERVERRGRHVEVEWDDGIVLDTHLRHRGTWHVHRRNDTWLHRHDEVRALIEVPGWVAVCFNAPLVETFRVPDTTRHPGLGGGLGPDLCRQDADLGRCVERLLHYRHPAAPLADVLLDVSVFCGLGNVIRSEVLWACALSPRAPASAVREPDAVRLVDAAARLVRTSLRERPATAPTRSATGGDAGVGVELAVYGRRGRRCPRCDETIRSRRTGGVDHESRPLYWCPGCQVGLDPRRAADDGGRREMDPHPAAARYIADLPWRRTG